MNIETKLNIELNFKNSARTIELKNEMNEHRIKNEGQELQSNYNRLTAKKLEYNIE